MDYFRWPKQVTEDNDCWKGRRDDHRYIRDPICPFSHTACHPKKSRPQGVDKNVGQRVRPFTQWGVSWCICWICWSKTDTCWFYILSGWWLSPTPLNNMKVSWDYYSQYMEESNMFQTTNQICFYICQRNECIPPRFGSGNSRACATAAGRCSWWQPHGSKWCNQNQAPKTDEYHYVLLFFISS